MARWITIITGPGAVLGGVGSGATLTLILGFGGFALVLMAVEVIDRIILNLTPVVVALLFLSAWQAAFAVLSVVAISLGPMLLVAYTFYSTGGDGRQLAGLVASGCLLVSALTVGPMLGRVAGRWLSRSIARQPTRAAALWRGTATFLLGVPSVLLVHAIVIADQGASAMRTSAFVFGALAASLVLSILLWRAMRRASEATNAAGATGTSSTAGVGLSGGLGALLGGILRIAAAAAILLFLVAGMFFAIREAMVLPLVLVFLLTLLLVAIQLGLGLAGRTSGTDPTMSRS